MPSVSEPKAVPSGPKETPEQYKPELSRSPQGDFMRPAIRTRKSSNTNGVGVQVEDTRICVVMVGLPARGKSLIAQKGITSYLRHVFIVANLLTLTLSREVPWLA